MNNKLKRTLLAMGKRDQDVRLKGKWSNLVDKKNTNMLRRIITLHGWPTISQVGEDASHAAWLVATHSSSLSFQKDCLKKIQIVVKLGEAKKRTVPYLVDKILTREKKKQLYGTQFHVVKNKFEPIPIKSPRGLNQRRKKFELETFEKYAKKFDNRDVARFKTLFKKNKKK